MSGMSLKKCIGIVGGVGPYAGLDLKRKIFDQTVAERDQDHLRVVLISSSVDIHDRTEYLLGGVGNNPAFAISKVIQDLELIGVDVVGIPCNTAHAPKIFDVLIDRLQEEESQVEVIHMIKEVVRYIKRNYPMIGKVGVLATNGTVYSDVYGKWCRLEGIDVIYPDKGIQYSKVHACIYSEEFGIKAKSNPVTSAAREIIVKAIEHVFDNGAEAIILGCSELPLAVALKEIRGRPILDANLILARALIERVAPHKLKDA